MITHYPVPFGAPAATAGKPSRRVPAASTDTWRYDRSRRSRPMVVAGAVLSAGLHLGLLFGFNSKPAPAPTVKMEETLIAIHLTPPEIKDLEEPERIFNDEAGPAPDLSTLVPMQADLPQLPQPSDFVQALNFTSLIDKPDFSNMNVTVVPETFHGGRKLAESIGKVFNIADLDRVPEPLLQPAPLFPHAMRREALTGTVNVEFIVDTEGVVVSAFVMSSTNSGFDESALAGVRRWKFRPGIRDGRKVNTRMRVPIAFALHDE